MRCPRTCSTRCPPLRVVPWYPPPLRVVLSYVVPFVYGVFLRGALVRAPSPHTHILAPRPYHQQYYTRMLVGFWEGGSAPALDLLAEFMLPKDRGLVMNAANVAFGLGALFVIVLAQFTIPYYGWRVYLAVCALPMLIALVAMCWLVESPRWLVQMGNEEGAMRALRTIAKRNDVAMPCEKLIIPRYAGIEQEEVKNKAPLARYYIYMMRSWRSIKGIFSQKLLKRYMCEMSFLNPRPRGAFNLIGRRQPTNDPPLTSTLPPRPPRPTVDPS